MSDPGPIVVAPHAQSILDVLAGAPFPVGDHRAPKGADGEIVTPCAALYLRPGGVPVGSIAYPQTDGLLRFQVTGVHRSGVGALAVLDEVDRLILGQPLTVAGRYVPAVRRDNTGARAERDPELPDLFYAVALYRALTNVAPDELGS